MKKAFKNILVVAALASLSACKKDYLTTSPTDAMATETVFSTTQYAKLAVNGLAKMMTQQYLGTQGMNGEGTIKMWYGNYPGNHFSLNLGSWAVITNHLYNENVTSIYLYYPWYYYYKIIGNANAIINRIDAATGPDSEKALYKAQALTYRAYSFMMLAQLYGNRWSDTQNGTTLGIILRLDESTGDIARSTMMETYNQIYADLDQAIALYQSSGLTRSSSINYETNINTAYAIYARAALNRQDYATAETNAVKARNGYPLMSVTEYNAGFNTPNKEWIWSSYGGSTENLFFYSYFGYIAYNSTGSNVRTVPKMISRELYNKIPATDIRRNLFLNPGANSYTTSTGLAATNSALYKAAFAARPTLQSNASVYAYMQFKISATDVPGVGNLNHFRSSEMYLIEAEAKYFQNKPDADIQNLLVTLTAGSGRDPNYTCTKTGADLLNEIKLYRAIEFWGEGFDWFDMKRWGDPISRKDYAGGSNFIAQLAVNIAPAANNKWTWKIPQRETDYNTLAQP
ncbi:RagB/SusD family nutrient uptake outer membrane protein [Niastella caeni]|uniref:RagB/SusD family nutrient uptake outer membrane protein n=1 Tax=Niastella caeni TaxID=2569763 RepID=A0A4S8HMP0_9BACT|nr:RagB/SusD family nutrient uptake outer membrane protein [Niastella caeni]THU35981.1 RagB/SusD family nutrient uptake outer membrane protein [Niastella caeni]